jgi:hypothetical protein
MSFGGYMEGGATNPVHFHCVNDVGGEGDFVVKAHSTLGHRILCELAAVHLAGHFDITTPGCAAVVVDDWHAYRLERKECRDAFLATAGPHFGSLLMKPGRSELEPHYLSEEQLPQAINIFAFDMLIQNIDRASQLPGKPNVLIKGNDIVAIDHEKAFSFINALEEIKPWDLRGTPFATNHLFYRLLFRHTDSRKTINFESFAQQLLSLNTEDLRDLLVSAPESWRNDRTIDKIVGHMELAKSNATRFEKGLLEVFNA